MSVLRSIGTVDPPFRYAQEEVMEFMLRMTSTRDQRDERLLKAIHGNSGIQNRFSVLPDFSEQNGERVLFSEKQPKPSVSDRMKVFNRESLPLAQEAVKKTLGNGTVNLDEEAVTHLITVSCTGLSAPGMDIELIKRTGLRNDIERHSVNFMGCYAVFQALRLADHICSSKPKSKVLIVSVELCTLHFDPEPTMDHLMSNALFGDGAAACLVEGEPSSQGVRLNGFASRVIPEGESDMGWNLSESGFLMKLSTAIPDLVEAGASCLFSEVLEEQGLGRDKVDRWAVHPGGRKVLEAVARSESLDNGALEPSFEVLRERGNLSSPTILHVLEKTLDRSEKGDNILACGFGPGLTMEACSLQVT